MRIIETELSDQVQKKYFLIIHQDQQNLDSQYALKTVFYIQLISKIDFPITWNWRIDMFNKSILISLTIFFFLMIFTSIIKNNTRNIEKNIERLSREVSILEKDLNDSKIDFIYLSSPEKLTKNLSVFDNEKYFIYDRSRIFFSTDEFSKINSQEAKQNKKN